ncbi:hypothetical protein GTO10_06980 [Candidatus Saccharibacteria bacterium]|nr:hypothetical protein [Candidatus Saccharibacteria bacterium]
MQTIPWFAVLSPNECFVKKVPGRGWGIYLKVGELEYLVTFGNPDIFPTIFPTKRHADGIRRNLANVFDYIRGRERVENLSNDPKALPLLEWRSVPVGSEVKAHAFAGNVWGVVAITGDGPHLVVFDELDEETGLKTFSASREEIQSNAAFLNCLLDKTVAEGTRTPPFHQGTVQIEPDVPRELIAEDLEELWYIEVGWLLHLNRGNRRSCTCLSCRSEYTRRLNAILDRYVQDYGHVPVDIQVAADIVESGWRIVENRSSRR